MLFNYRLLTLIFLSSQLYAKTSNLALSQEVKKLLQKHPEERRWEYCIPERKTCRALVQLKGTKSFYNSFVSIERGACAIEYYLLNANGTYRAYLDETCGKNPKIQFKDFANQNLKVTFNSDNLPTIHNTLLRKHKSTLYAFGDLSYNLKSSIITGLERDSANSAYKKQLRVIYVRAKPEMKLP